MIILLLLLCHHGKNRDERKTTERLLNSEKFYIQLLNKTMKTYLTNIPDDLQLKMADYLNAIKSIIKFHTTVFYPKLQQSDLNITTICDTFKMHIESMDFATYNTYAAYANEAHKLLLENATMGDVSYLYLLI